MRNPAAAVGIPMYIPVMLLYFFGGFWFLNRLLRKKDHNLKLGLVGTKVMPKEDFAKLLDQVQVTKERMQQKFEPVQESVIPPAEQTASVETEELMEPDEKDYQED